MYVYIFIMMYARYSHCIHNIRFIIIIIHWTWIVWVCIRWDWYFCLSAHTRTDQQHVLFRILIYNINIYLYVYIVVVCVGGKRRVPDFFSAIIHRRVSPSCSITLPPIAVLKGKNNMYILLWCILYYSSRSKNKTITAW